MIVQLVEQATEDSKFTGSYTATADIRKHGKELLITAWQGVITIFVEQSANDPMFKDLNPAATGIGRELQRNVDNMLASDDSAVGAAIN
jgi:hypothetical protein